MLAIRGSFSSGLGKILSSYSNFPVLSNVSASSIILKRNQSAVPQSGAVSDGKKFFMLSIRGILCFFVLLVAVEKKKPYSPFQNTNNMAEYAVARLDDLLNWGRKVYFHFLIHCRLFTFHE